MFHLFHLRNRLLRNWILSCFYLVGLRMLFSKHSFILIPYIFMSITQGCSSQALSLGQYRWSKGVIVTSSQSEEHPEVARLKAEISQRKCEYNNRNLVHEHINTGETGDGFKIDLIGYDGDIKYTGYESSLQTIFQIIDLMPMRRREMSYDNPC